MSGGVSQGCVPPPATGGLAICPLSGIPDGGSSVYRDPRQPLGSWEPGIILVRRGVAVFAYRNDCPHRGGPLDMIPGQVLDASGRHIQCATHGALFAIDTGRCVFGPCRDEGLTPMPVTVVDGMVRLVGAADPS